MKIIKLIISVWALAAILACIFGNVSIASEYGSTTASFLKIGVGSKAMGMGGAFTSIADDPSAIYWNPAGLRQIENRQLQFSHYDWYQDVKIENLYFVASTKSLSYGVGITYLDFGDFQSYDVDGNAGDNMSFYNLALSFSIAGSFNEKYSVGISAKYIEQSFDIVKGQAFAVDLGFMADFDLVRVALAASNIGTKMKFVSQEEKLPVSVRAGISTTRFDNKALFSLEMHAPLEGALSVHQGTQIMLAEQLFIRSGVKYNTEAAVGSNSFGYNLGLGLAYGSGKFDYSFLPSENFGSEAIHSFSLSFSW